MADYSRPASGFRFKFGGMKTNAPADAVGSDKYPFAQNVRETEESTLKTRPGLTSLFNTAANQTVTDIRSYTQLNGDASPRFLCRNENGHIYLDTGSDLGVIGVGPDGKLGVSMVPFRPAQSPTPYMYIANGVGYRKFSSPDAADTVISQVVGIAEPQSPPEVSIWNQQFSIMGQPAGGTYAPGGNAGPITVGSRVSDTIQGVFPDPNGGPSAVLQVGGGGAGSPLAPGVYLGGRVNLYIFGKDPGFAGGFPYQFPLDIGTAQSSWSGNSLNVNPPQFNGDEDPDVRPFKWATINASGGITGYQTVSGPNNSENFAGVFTLQLYVSAPGTYNLEIDHDDGIIFAIQGAKLISGPFSDDIPHTKTAVQGYHFSNGTVAGTNQSGYRKENFQIQFPSAGFYPMEIDWAQWVNELSMNVYSGGNRLFLGGPPAGAASYQRFMDIKTQTGATPNPLPPLQIQDVYPPLPASIDILGIYYYSGNTGKCVVVPANMSPAPGTEGQSLYTQNLLAGIRRGSLVKIGDEVCMVLSTTAGPDGTISFETSTINAHTNTDQLSGVLGIAVLGQYIPAVGDSITSPDVEFSATSGVGTATAQITANPFINANVSFQPDDYIHFSVNVDSLAALNEIKLLFDISDGSFTRDFFFYTVRPSDIAAGVQNSLTQLGVAQLVNQRATIDEEKAASAANQGVTHSSAQTNPGDNQWSEILFPISAMTRVGNNQGATLQNVGAMQLLINANALVNIKWNSTSVSGGYQGDVGQSGAPYLYRVRPRSRATGVVGNPSPAIRYGTNPRRQLVRVFLPSAAYDPQIDTWDVFRYGGTVPEWRFIGSTPSSNPSFDDNYGDAAALAGEALAFDNHEPWPSIDLPLQATAIQVIGTTALVTIPAPTEVQRYLPGNQVKIGNINVYTLWNRPTQIDPTTYLFQLQENAGFQGAVTVSIYEPALARQPLPYMWGPDASGTVFACGDTLRAGTLSFTKSNDPDAAPDRYNLEITSPSEPLLGGEVLNGLSYVASSLRWWALYPQPGGLNRFNPVQQPMPRGLAAPFGHCTDGRSVYWWAKDGIWSSDKGSLTDADLYNLFPHEGVPGQSYTYAGHTVPPPDYGRASAFRLAKVNDYLYATYQDSDANYHQLVMNVRTGAWRIDVYQTPVSVVYQPEQPEGRLYSTSATPPPDTLYPACVMGNTAGTVATQTDNANDLGSAIQCVVSTMEWDGGDVRGGKQWGDFFMDVLPASDLMFVQPISFGQSVSVAQIVPQTAARQQELVSLGGGFLSVFLGMDISWSDDLTAQNGQPTVLYSWQPSFLVKQEISGDRDSDWMPVQPDGKAGYVQGFLLRADTFALDKALAIRDSDTLGFHTFTPVVNQTGESTKAYSFDTPFVAHLVRIEPQDTVPWRLFDVRWVAEATPEIAETWQTQSTAFGLNGYSHIQRILAAYSSTADVTLTITAIDGTSPAPIVLPASAGALTKALFMCSFNKGLLYAFKASSPQPFQFYLDDFEIRVGHWGRTDGYLNYKSLGGHRGDKAEI